MPYQATAENYFTCEAAGLYHVAVCVLIWYQTTTVSTCFLIIFMQRPNFQSHFSTFTPPQGREGVFIFAICPLSFGLLVSPAPLLFYPACGASSCCCCPPALCSCSSEEPLQAASRSLSQSPACRRREINQCVYTGRDAVKY